MLRLLQAFIQAAPQAVFQLYVQCHKGTFVLEHDLIIVISAATSIVTVVWSLVCYSKALRDLRENAQNLPWVGFTCQCLWRTCMLTSRIVALALFASHFQHWTLLAVFGHWLLMAMWLACQRTQFCVDETGREHPWKERIFNSLIAFIYVFSFFNTKEGMTRKRVVLYYSVMLVENSLLISMWYPNRNLNTIMTYSALSVVWGGFLLGLFFMIIYYRCYHHTHAFKGLFVRIKTFSLHGRNMYGVYFCCCCRVRKWDAAIYDCRESSAEPSVSIRQEVEQDQVVNPEVYNPYDGLHWDNDDIQMRPLNGACVRADEADTDNPTIAVEDEQVPDIIVTAASPLVLSPQESIAKLSHEDPVTFEISLDNDTSEPPLSPGQTSLDKAREILASKLAKDNDTQSNGEQDEEDDIPKINYGTVSFGNRYSLVSSDCISISSESSLSSFTNSLNDLLDRMGIAPKKEENEQTDVKITTTTDEGIYSDERESPSKSGETASDPSPCIDLDSSISTVSPISSNMVNGDIENVTTPKQSPRKEESIKVLESIMDAPSSPYFTAKRKRKHDKDEGSESESTDASSDDRERRHSCEEIFTDFSLIRSTPNEEETKRHSFDIAELSSSYNRAKKKRKNKRRFNKIVIFDNFVSSPLKPGRFGSLRKSFERLSKIQEDTEELGLLSNESLKANRELEKSWSKTLSNENNEQIKDLGNLATEDSDVIINDNTNDKTYKESDHSFQKSAENSHNPDDQLSNSKTHKSNEKLTLTSTNDYTNINGQADDVSESGRERSGSEISDDDFLIDDLKPSRFSTVRRSRDNVPLACFEDFDDDLGSSVENDMNNLGDDGDNINKIIDGADINNIEDNVDINSIDDGSGINSVDDEDVINNLDDGDTAPLTVTPTPQKTTKKLHWSTDSIAGSDSSRDSPNDTINQSIASSGSSIFENFLFLENEQSNSSEAKHNKRHTFDFGAHRKNNVRNDKVKRLGTSSSHYALPRSPGSPVWIHKAIYTHRRRNPKPNTQGKNNDHSAGLFIQEVRV